MKKFTGWVLAMTLVLGISSCSTSSMLSSGSSLLSSLGGNSSLSSITSLLQTPGLESVLGSSMKEPFTLLAPSNSAMGSLSADALANLQKPENINQLASVLNKHIVPGKLDAAALSRGGLKTAGGSDLNLSGVNMGEMISGKKFNVIPVDKILP